MTCIYNLTMRKTNTMIVPCSSIRWSHRTRGIRPRCRFSSPPSLAACSVRGSAGEQSGWQQVLFFFTMFWNGSTGWHQVLFLLQCLEILIEEIFFTPNLPESAQGLWMKVAPGNSIFERSLQKLQIAKEAPGRKGKWLVSGLDRLSPDIEARPFLAHRCLGNLV